ncbi:MAG: ATP-dependent DNA ligase [Candidatus Dojkabacteria bacterium]
MQKTKFSQVCKVFDSLESISSRNEMTSVLAEFYKKLDKEDSQILSYLVLGRVAPSFVNSEFNYSEKSFSNLLSNLVSSQDIKGIRDRTGDIGDTVYEVAEKMNFTSDGILLNEIYDIFWKIIKTSGTGSVESKNILISETLKKLSPLEAKYFTRIVCGSLRFGINYKTLLDVFSFTISGDKSLREELGAAYGVYSDIGYICSSIVGLTQKDAVTSLDDIKIKPGIPVLSRLVERVNSFEEVFERLGTPVLVQPKFDGLRCQIHKYNIEDFINNSTVLWARYMEDRSTKTLFEKKEDAVIVRLFTRNLEDVTEMFPEIVDAAKNIKQDSFILDSEVLGWDGKNFLPFQDTMQRRRKYGVGALQKDIPVKAMCFDVLYLNGKGLLNEDTENRVKILNDIDTHGGIENCSTLEVADMGKLEEVFDENISKGYEGIIVKQLKGSYLPGVRNYEWIKLKKSMINALVDTVDLVAIGYFLGSGRRAGLGAGAILGALYNEKEDKFEGICKVGTGFSDELLKKIVEEVSGDVVKEKLPNVNVPKSLEPDIWVYPKIVFTVEADEITRRMVKGEKNTVSGLSLRFPRLVEWGRDKGATEATTVEELDSMFRGREKEKKKKLSK